MSIKHQIIKEKSLLFLSCIKIPSNRFSYLLDKSIYFSNRDEEGINNYYNNRNASKPKEDIIFGKLGECFVAEFLTESFGLPLIEPDFKIYKSHDKNWTADLDYNPYIEKSFKVNVKTCTPYVYRLLKKGSNLSWTFQFKNKNNKFGRDALFNSFNKDAIVFLTFVNGISKYDTEAFIYASCLWADIKPLLKDPIYKKYNGIKKCLYSSDIMHNLKSR
jgi:hypothetical protein